MVDEFKTPPAEGLTIRIADRRVGLVMHEKISASARSRQIGSGIGRLPIFYEGQEFSDNKIEWGLHCYGARSNEAAF